MSLVKNQVISLVITSISSDGNGVGRYEGQAVFVPFTAPGDEVQVRIVKVCKTYAFGIVHEIVQQSKHRIASDCPIDQKCGGCCFRHLSYEQELFEKRHFVADAFSRIGGLDVSVEPVLASPQINGYRNKAQLPVYQDENGMIKAGFYAQRSHRIVPCEDCKLQPNLMNKVVRQACATLTNLKVSVYQEKMGTGWLRHIYIRHSIQTDAILLCLVVTSGKFQQAEQFCKEMLEYFPQIQSIVLNINPDKTNVILGKENIVLYGDGKLHDEMAGVPVELNALSFYQVNTKGANKLYQVVSKLAGLTGTQVLLDLYCGAGTIGLSMAHQCKTLIGVEIVAQAVEDAKQNAKKMGITHTSFLCADAKQAVQMLLKQRLQPDVVILDPPRKGCSEQTLSAVVEMNPQRIVMVSCNPATAARDIAYLTNQGYQTKQVQPVDLFPRTKHVECVVLMQREYL